MAKELKAQLAGHGRYDWSVFGATAGLLILGVLLLQAPSRSAVLSADDPYAIDGRALEITLQRRWAGNRPAGQPFHLEVLVAQDGSYRVQVQPEESQDPVAKEGELQPAELAQLLSGLEEARFFEVEEVARTPVRPALPSIQLSLKIGPREASLTVSPDRQPEAGTAPIEQVIDRLLQLADVQPGD